MSAHNFFDPQQITLDVLQEKYCKGTETTIDEIIDRVALGVAQAEKTEEDKAKWAKIFAFNMKDGNLGAGRIMSVGGTGIQASMINCFSGDTVVLTSQGPKKLKEVSGLKVEVNTLEGFKEAEIKSFGKQRIFEILFSNGQTVKTTAGHEWIVPKEISWGNLKDNLEKVKTTDMVNRKVLCLPTFTRPEKDEEYHKGVVHGIVYGDGSKVVNRKDNAYYIHLFNQKRELSKYFEKYSQTIKVSNSYEDESTYIYGIKIEEVNLKQVPSTDNHSLSYIYGFISGLIATDGNVCSNQGSVTIFQSNFEEIQEISNLIAKVGMSYTSVSMYRKFSPFDGSVKPCYVIRLRRNSGTSEDFIRNDQKFNFTKIESKKIQTQTAVLVTDTGVDEEVFCAVEPVTRSFVIEGNILTGNCFVQGVGDSISIPDVDGFPGIYEALKDAAETLRRGGGVGFDFSRIRPKDAYVKGTDSNSSGPCSYIDVFDSSCRTVESAGMRRSATMGVLRIDHPDILDFIRAKRTKGRWNNFNVSVYVSDAFMKAKNEGKKWKLVHKAQPSESLIEKNGCYQENGVWVYEEVDATMIWDTIMQSTYDYAEPGILFGDTINNNNNLRYIEVLEATNP